MPDTTITTEATDALKLLTEAVAPLAKSVREQVAEALTAHNEATVFDKAYAEIMAKLAKMVGQGSTATGATASKTPTAERVDGAQHPKVGQGSAATPTTTKKPGMDADGDYDGDTAEEVGKAVELRDLAKVSHEIVAAYLQTAEDKSVEKPEESPWAGFAKEVQEYHTKINTTLSKQVEDWRKRSAELRDGLAKADGDAKKKMSDEAEATDSAAEECDEAAKMAKFFAEVAVWPKPIKKLDKPMTMAKGYMSIQSTADLMNCVSEYKSVDLKDQPPVYAHIMDAAKALNEPLPEGWHHPVTLPPVRSEGTGSDQTSRVYDITEGDKATAMAKGVTIIGPTAGLLGTIRALNASTLVERMATMKNKSAEDLRGWMTKGEELLKAIVADEAESIRILDIPTFPEAPALKVDHWASVAAKACVETVTDTMPIEQRTLRKELAGRLDAAAEVFKKATATEDLSKRSEEQIEALTKERDELQDKITKFTSSLVPLTRSAQAQKEELKKVAAERDNLQAELAKLKAEPMPSRGRVGEGGLISKADDGAQTDTGTNGSKDLMAKIADLPPGAERGYGLIALAHRLRAEEEAA